MVYLHIPKTGGTFIRNAFKTLDINYVEIGNEHSRLPVVDKYVDDKRKEEILVWTVIRHPLTWYQSYWAYRLMIGWAPSHPLDRHCASNDFNVFVNNCLDFVTTGWVSKESMAYTYGIESYKKYYIGYYETLNNSFLTALRLSNINIEEQQLYRLTALNVSMLDGKKSYQIAKYNHDTYHRVMEVERDFIYKYYNGYQFDPKQLF